MTLLESYRQGIIQKNSYIRMALCSPRYQQGDNYQINLPLPEAKDAEVLAIASQLVRNGLIDVNIEPFSINWVQPESLPSYSPSQVLELEVGGPGYLYFALGADNQSKTQTQQINPSRIYTFYKMSKPAFLAELSRLINAGTCTATLPPLRISWLNRVAINRQFNSVDEAVAILRQEIAQTAANNSGGTVDLSSVNAAISEVRSQLTARATIDHEHEIYSINNLEETLNQLATEINDRQLRGSYATTQALADAIVLMQNAMSQLQPGGDYALRQNLTDAIATRQPVGDYSTNQALSAAIATLQNAIALKADIAQEARIAPTLMNTWTRYSQNYAPASFVKNTIGEVFFAGLVKGGTIGQPIFTLPEGYRPSFNRMMLCNSTSTTPTGAAIASTILIQADGSVIPVSGNNACFSLEGVRFRAN